ncbi:MAG: alpha-galactosidase [Lentisphaerae bacterium]|nr:alpha-galactosidase [Lentisphaerota bacterium]
MANTENLISFNNDQALIICGNERLKFNARLFVGNRWTAISYKDGDVLGIPGLKVFWHSEVGPAGIVLNAVLENRGKVPLTLGAFHLLESSEGLPGTAYYDAILIDSASGWFTGVVRVTATCPPYMEYWENYFLAEEDIDWARKIQGDLKDGAHYSLSGMFAYRRQNNALPSWIFSFVAPMKRCIAVPIMLANPTNGSIRAIALSNNFAGYVLEPGERIETEEVLIGSFDDPHAGIEEWASFCAARRDIKVWPKRPPVGWLSWYGYRLTQNAADTIRTADLIKNKLDGLDFEYIQLDLGYNKGNLPGDWFEVNDHFADGLPSLAKEISSRGFKLGVWVCPFFVAADSSFAKEHPEALLPSHPNDPQKWYWEPHCNLFQLDPTHPEGEKFLRRIVTYFKAMGVTYFKFDFCGRMGRVDKGFVPSDRKTVKGVELYRRGLQIIMEMMDKDDYVYWCSNILHFGLGFGATSMTACDIGNTGFSQTNKIEGRTENIDYFRQQATTTMSRYYMHKKLLMLNPDALNLAPPADIEECRMRAALVTMSGGQMFLGDRFDLADEDRFDLIRQCAPPYGRAARPVDMFKNVYPESYPQVWHLHVDTGWDEREVISFLNCDKNKTYTVALTDLHLPADRTCHAWEFWEKRSLGKVKGSFSIDVPATAARLVVLVPERKHPWVLSTSFHVTQGGVELSQVKWDEKSRTLSGTLNRPKGMTGAIYIMTPDNYSCLLGKVAPQVYSLPLTGNGGKLPWSVRFSHGND